MIRTSSRDNPEPPLPYLKISGGIFHDMLCHDFDMHHFITGEVRRKRERKGKREREERKRGRKGRGVCFDVLCRDFDMRHFITSEGRRKRERGRGGIFYDVL